MAILRANEIRKMDVGEIEEKLEELDTELMKIRSEIGSGGAPDNPGRVKEVKKTIARLKTIKKEKKESK